MIKTAARLDTVQEYYFSKKLAEVSALRAQGKAIINMGIGSPDLSPPKSVTEQLKQALLAPNAHQYQSYKGLPELRSAIAHFYSKWYKVSLDAASQILPMMGSKEAIMHISLAFLNPGDEVLIPNPGYPTYTSVTKLVQAEPKYYDLSAERNWFPDLDKLAKEDLSRIKIMWINYPHMPTGSAASLEQLSQVVEFAKRHHILVINDNPYSFILNENPTSILEVPDALDCAIELNSLSKSLNMAGWRVGMAVGHESHIESILKVKSNMDSGMFYGIQMGAIAALQVERDWFNKLNNIYAKRRELVFQLADKLKCTYERNATGLFVWAKLPNGSETAAEYIDKLLHKHSIFIAPGTIFGSNGEGYIRFSLCVQESSIKEAISRL
jgi:aspartate/methionine/tyrosine aminotransferase